MRTALILFLSIFSIMDIYSQDRVTDRQPVAAGRFYSAGRETLTKDIAGLFSGCKKPSGNLKVRAIIVLMPDMFFPVKLQHQLFQRPRKIRSTTISS